MAEKASKDDAAKQRIISHMNKDHHDSVVRYLEHFSNVSGWAAFDGKMVDIDLNGLTISCQGKPYQIPISPPMTSYAQARERVVELDKEARKALGRSDVTVKQYLPPTGPFAIGFLVIVATVVAYSQRWWFAPGQIVEHILGSRFAAFSFRIQPWLVPSLAAVHGLETMIFFTKLKKHSVSPRTSTFWLWTLSAFIEGQFAWKRFDSHVKAQREKQKH